MNEYSIRKTFEALQKNGKPIEVRIVSGKATFSGYFKDIDNLIEKLKPFDKVNTANVYFVLNDINDACYDRQQCEVFIQSPKQTTSDLDIRGRDWLLIDIDPIRSAGVSASNEEKANAESTFGCKVKRRASPFEIISTESSIAEICKNAVRKRYLNG